MDYLSYEQWLDGELERLELLDAYFDQQIIANRDFSRASFSRKFTGEVSIAQILPKRLYILNETGKPLGLLIASHDICSRIKETDKLLVRIGFKDCFWHLLRLDSISYAQPNEDLANQQKIAEQFELERQDFEAHLRKSMYSDEELH